MKIIKSHPHNKVRGKWDFIQTMEWDDCLVFETETECDNARRAMRWHGFKTTQKKTREGWRIWKLPADPKQV